MEDIIMKRLVLVVCLLLTVMGFGFAKDNYFKSFSTLTKVASKYDDGKLKYAITEGEIRGLLIEDCKYYFYGMIDSGEYRTDGIEKIDIKSCVFGIYENDNDVYVTLFVDFYLLSGRYEEGIPLNNGSLIINTLREMFEEAWEAFDDPIIEEIRSF